jgi:hypothetical protein
VTDHVSCENLRRTKIDEKRSASLHSRERQGHTISIIKIHKYSPLSLIIIIENYKA